MTKDKSDRPPCPKCGHHPPIGNGQQWLCKQCGKEWRKISRSRKEPNWSERPNCPACGCEKVISHGRDWACIECGKNFRKNYRISQKQPFIFIDNSKLEVV